MKKQRLVSAAKHLAIYIITGAMCGCIGTAFSSCVALATNIRHSNSWLIYLLPLAGIISVTIYKLLKVSGMGTNQVLKSTENLHVLSPKLTPAIFFASILSHLCGASVGREGAALQLGGSSSLFLGQIFKLNEKDEKILIYCGMAGVFSSVFGTPFAATLFSLEVVSIGHLFYRAFLPVFITSITSYTTSVLLGSHAERFVLSAVPSISGPVVLKALILCLSTVILGVLFCLALELFEKVMKKVFKNEFIRIAVCGGAIIVLTMIIGSLDYTGAGIDIIEKIFEHGHFIPWAFALKILFTCISVGGGYKGGEIVPTLFIGATFGAFAGNLLNMPVAFSAAICMIILFCTVTNCPIASILLAAELFSCKGILYISVAVIISFFISGKISLYAEQKTDEIKALF